MDKHGYFSMGTVGSLSEASIDSRQSSHLPLS